MIGGRFGRLAAGFILVTLVAVPADAQQKPPAKPQPQPPAIGKPSPAKPKQPRQYRGFIAIGGAVQVPGSQLSDQFTFDVHAESGTTTVDYASKSAPGVDVTAGWRFWKTTGMAVGFSRTAVTAAVQTESQIPHPFFDDRDRLVSGEAGNISRSETALHAQFFYLREHKKWRTRVLGGLSYFTVQQDLVTAVNVTETYPYDVAEFRSVTTQRGSGSAPGFNAGIDLTRMFTPQVGFGGAVRLARGKIDLNGSDDRNVSTNAGGAQATVGIRIAF